MIYTPAPHHESTIDWFMDRPAAAVWLDMGSGKTASTATVMDRLLDSVDVTRWLVVATPRIAEKVWFNEFAKWDHLNGLGRRSYHITSEDLPVVKVDVIRKGKTVKVFKLINPRELRRKLLRIDADVFTIHYDLLARLVKLFGDEWPFDGLVMDESSMVSEQDTARFKALRRIRGQVSRLYQLTGTPASNGLEKLFTQAYLLDGGKRLGRTLTEFRENYLMPVQMDRSGGRVFKWGPQPGARERIYAALGDICMSLNPGDWIKLPEVTYNSIMLELPAAARSRYNEIESEYITWLGEGNVIEAANAAVLGGKLLQLCNGTIYDAERVAHEVHSVKLDALAELIEVSDSPILLAYWFDHDYQRIKARFPKAVSLADAPDFEERWNRGEIPLGLVQPASGGHGLNLQDGGYLACWYGPIHNLELYLQFNKRLPRPGQKAGRVTIHHLVIADSIEEAVLLSNEEKNEEQEALVLAVRRRIASKAR